MNISSLSLRPCRPKKRARALGPADPVLLHEADLGRPALEPVEGLAQLLGVGGDAEEPLGELAPLHRRARAPAAAVDHLLVGQHRLVDGVPVDARLLAMDQAGLEEVEEHGLLVAIVVGVAGGDLARPVEGQPHGLQLPAHGGDVVIGPFGRMDLLLHGRVLGRQAEGVPAHGMEHVEAPGALEAGDHVAQRVVAHMAHVDAARGIGEHLEDVVLGPRRIGPGGKAAALGPGGLPLAFGFVEIVARRTGACLPHQRAPIAGCRRFASGGRASGSRFPDRSPSSPTTGASVQLPPWFTWWKTAARSPSARSSRPRM